MGPCNLVHRGGGRLFALSRGQRRWLTQRTQSRSTTTSGRLRAIQIRRDPAGAGRSSTKVGSMPNLTSCASPNLAIHLATLVVRAQCVALPQEAMFRSSWNRSGWRIQRRKRWSGWMQVPEPQLPRVCRGIRTDLRGGLDITKGGRYHKITCHW